MCVLPLVLLNDRCTQSISPYYFSIAMTITKVHRPLPV